MKNWQYTYALVDRSDDPVKEINQLGSEGWEVVAYEPQNKDHHGVFFLKREVIEHRPQQKIGGWHLCNRGHGLVMNGKSCPVCATGEPKAP